MAGPLEVKKELCDAEVEAKARATSNLCRLAAAAPGSAVAKYMRPWRVRALIALDEVWLERHAAIMAAGSLEKLELDLLDKAGLADAGDD